MQHTQLLRCSKLYNYCVLCLSVNSSNRRVEQIEEGEARVLAGAAAGRGAADRSVGQDVETDQAD